MNSRLAALAALLICAPVFGDDAVFIQVLGIAQDAGYPQTSCYQPHCMRAWENPELRRKASSIAVVDQAHKTNSTTCIAPRPTASTCSTACS
jgi:hypothetical protein